MTLVDTFPNFSFKEAIEGCQSLKYFAIHFSALPYPPAELSLDTTRLVYLLLKMLPTGIETLHITCLYLGSFQNFSRLRALSIPLKDLLGPQEESEPSLINLLPPSLVYLRIFVNVEDAAHPQTSSVINCLSIGRLQPSQVVADCSLSFAKGQTAARSTGYEGHWRH
jgi:hypothetical protein